VVSPGGSVITGNYEVVSVNGNASEGNSPIVGGVVNGGDTQELFAGAFDFGTTILDGGTQSVGSGATVIETQVASGGTQSVEYQATAAGTVVESGGYLADSGTVRGAVVESGGYLALSRGGIAIDTVLQGGTIWENGAASGTVISAGGVEEVNFSATSASVGAGGRQIVEVAGRSFDTTIGSGGIELVSSGGTASASLVQSGGVLLVLPGGSAVATDGETGGHVISTGGIWFAANSTVISAAATLSGTDLVSGQTELVLAGGSALSAVVSGGATQDITGGEAVGTIVLSGGDVAVSAGGVVSSFVVSSGGTFELVSGTAIGTRVAGGRFSAMSGSHVSGLVVDPGGVAEIYGVRAVATSATVLQDGVIAVSENATLSSSTISAGGVELVFQGGASEGATVSSGGYQVAAGGNIGGAVILDGGTELVAAGFTEGTVVQSGGTQIVLPSGNAAGTVADPGGTVLSANVVVLNQASVPLSAASASISGASVTSGDLAIAWSGGAMVSATVFSGGEFIISGGGASATTVAGVLYLSGGTVQDGVVLSTGVEDIYGVASGETLRGGRQYVYGSAAGTVISNGGLQVVYAGIVTNTIVDSGGGEDVHNGIAYDTQVSAGGVEFVFGNGEYNFSSGDPQNGVASGAIVGSGGALIVEGAGVALGTTVATGGTLVVMPGGVQTGTVLSGGSIVSGAVVVTDLNGLVSVASSTTSGNDLNAGYHERVGSGGISLDALVGGDSVLQVFDGGTSIGATVAGGGVAEFQGASVASATVVESGGLIVSYNPISGLIDLTLQPGAGIDFMNVGGAIHKASIDPFTDVLSLYSVGSSPQLIQLEGNYAGDSVVLTDGAGGSELLSVEAPCYCRGTRVLTPDGERPVEELAIGDLLITRTGEARPIRWIGRRAYSGRFVAGDRNLLPILFTAGALADGVPVRDLLVSPLHALFLDGVLIPAWALVNELSIRQLEAVATLEYFHLELDTHDVILAEGALSESFVDDGGRDMFQNAGEYRVLYPNALPRAPRYCAPRLDAGELVETVHARLLARARALGFAAPPEPEAGVRVESMLVPPGSSLLALDRAGLVGLVLDGERLCSADLCWSDGANAIRIVPSVAERWCHIEFVGTVV